MAQSAESAEQLERRASDGDPDAQLAYGLSLLDGQNASVDGPKGIALVDAAARQGKAEAVAIRALFEAMGAARPQSRDSSLDSLREAAELGNESAQGQLRVLAERGSPGDPGAAPDWAGLRAAISPERLLEPPPRQMLSDMPRIVAFPGFATAGECAWIVGRTQNRLGRAKVFHTGTGDQTYNAVRDNSAIEFQLPQMDVVLEVIRARIAAATRLPVPIYEPLQVLHYAVGEQFRPHHDFLDPDAPGFAEQLKLYGQRIATVLVYLNDEYVGGQTIFPKIGISYRGNRGDALFFTNVDRSGRGDPLTMHAGTPPTSGEKWVVSQWIRDRAPLSPFAAGASGQ